MFRHNCNEYCKLNKLEFFINLGINSVYRHRKLSGYATADFSHGDSNERKLLRVLLLGGCG